MTAADTLLSVKGLTKHFTLHGDIYSKLAGEKTQVLKAVDGIDFHIKRGETLATTGETDRQVLPCIGCHGPQGIGEPPFTPYLAGQYGQYIVSQMVMFSRGYRKIALMYNEAHNLAEGDYEALGAYFEGLPRPSAK